jgi:hypothetical protein
MVPQISYVPHRRSWRPFKLNYVTQDVTMMGWACMSGADRAHLQSLYATREKEKDKKKNCICCRVLQVKHIIDCLDLELKLSPYYIGGLMLIRRTKHELTIKQIAELNMS